VTGPTGPAQRKDQAKWASPSSTPANLVIGAPGIVLLDSTDVGATEGNVVFRVAQTRFIPRVNGVSANLVGTAYIQEEHGELEVGTPEMSTALLVGDDPRQHERQHRRRDGRRIADVSPRRRWRRRQWPASTSR
jgi:hypothetical protein